MNFKFWIYTQKAQRAINKTIDHQTIKSKIQHLQFNITT